MGGSYGGYATLAGLTFTPDLFACGVDIVGPSNLKTLLESVPPYWAPMRKIWDLRMGEGGRRTPSSTSGSRPCSTWTRSRGRSSSGRARTTRA